MKNSLMDDLFILSQHYRYETDINCGHKPSYADPYRHGRVAPSGQRRGP